ncbi:Baseplate J-like protein [Saccharicrinis carchari]|uniref:Baseplate J-like protein n=1 Tax=Saccharicrinis carchari TaxID=1168039 RepID=A0A521CZ39_SACCC|nr:baseplate J/gp47 family protein [Saccharicrinis carchari]SMO64011.1 Baseplate J-like protein [Saccharicrinis carchari]
MANCGKEILFGREGTEQQQRYIQALDPASVKLNDFELKEWMQFAYGFASHVNYFASTDEKVVSGNWEDFFKSEPELDAFLAKVQQGNELTPHLALYVCFIQLLQITKRRFNQLTLRHLDFYYKQVLKIQKLPPSPDSVHILFELAKNAVSEKISDETELDAGKDADGDKLIYRTSEELIANKTQVAQLKSVYNDHDSAKLKAADVADSYDGKGDDFPDDEVKWWPFGYYKKEVEGIKNDYPELPDAQIGFALSGEILELKEGVRNVMITADFTTAPDASYTSVQLNNNLEIYCSGEKGWLGPFPVLNMPGFTSGLNAGTKKLQFAFQIPKDEEPVVKYDATVHPQSYGTDFPVCRIRFKTENSEAHALYRNIVEKELATLQVNVDVRQIKGISLYNDIGTINADKPFYPFGTQPVKKSKFYMDYPELFKKNWNDLKVDIEWKNTPDSFKQWYLAYRSSFITQISPYGYLDGIFDLAINLEAQKKMAIDKEAELAQNTLKIIQNPTETDLIVEGDDHFAAAVEINNKEDWDTVSGLDTITLFEKDGDIFETSFTVNRAATWEEDKNGPVRLSLNQTFLHEMFPRIYALAMSSDNDSVLIPNEPYTPFIEEISLDYKASAQIKVSGAKYDFNAFSLFHEHPFGQSEENLDLKTQNGLLDEGEDPVLNLVPTYCKGGELYIGLQDALPKQTISLLIQVLEGSENPEADSFVGKQKVEWHVLRNNEWMELDTHYMITNEIDNFLKSGIVKFSIPKEANNNNTLLPTGYVWVKAKIHKSYDAVSKVIGIHAQAVEAQFENDNNNLQHLENGLPAQTISKLINRIPKVKSLSQPYSSFDGKPEESNADYYTRVSERLRHKNRAICVWDYEHLVLQNFPEIHKVKCLSHTSTLITGNKRVTKYLAPGSVVVVVIPDIVNKNVFDIYQPRVSKATLNKIRDFLKKLVSPLIQIEVINTEYEELTVELKVKFYKGYDEVYYKTVLEQDLTKLLSPWAFDAASTLQFGITLHKSVVINYAEKLEYVDFVTDVKLHQKNAATKVVAEVNEAIPSSPEVILVSAKTHLIDTNINDCTNTNPEPAEVCQT